MEKLEKIFFVGFKHNHQKYQTIGNSSSNWHLHRSLKLIYFSFPQSLSDFEENIFQRPHTFTEESHEKDSQKPQNPERNYDPTWLEWSWKLSFAGEVSRFIFNFFRWLLVSFEKWQRKDRRKRARFKIFVLFSVWFSKIFQSTFIEAANQDCNRKFDVLETYKVERFRETSQTFFSSREEAKVMKSSKNRKKEKYLNIELKVLSCAIFPLRNTNIYLMPRVWCEWKNKVSVSLEKDSFEVS